MFHFTHPQIPLQILIVLDGAHRCVCVSDFESERMLVEMGRVLNGGHFLVIARALGILKCGRDAQGLVAGSRR